jgi:hypothetical protein
MLGIGGETLQGFGGGLKQQAVHLLFVLEGQPREGFGQSEDHMEIFARQQVGLALFQPLGPS